jgi:hypothetical protein
MGKLFLFLSICVLTSVQAQQLNCSQYTLDPLSGLSIAYRWYTRGTVPWSNTSDEANAFCKNLCSECGLAITRNVSTIALLYSLQSSGVALLNLTDYQTTVSYIGLQMNASGIWVWNDGQICNNSLPIDDRCYNTAGFDSSGSYGGIYSLAPNEIDDFDAKFGDGSLFCEVPRKLYFQCLQVDVFLQYQPALPALVRRGPVQLMETLVKSAPLGLIN